MPFLCIEKTLIEQSIFEGSSRKEAMKKKTIKNGLAMNVSVKLRFICFPTVLMIFIMTISVKSGMRLSC